MKDGFDLAADQIKAACLHPEVEWIEPRWEPDFIEEFGHYRCRKCRATGSYYRDGKLYHSFFEAYHEVKP